MLETFANPYTNADYRIEITCPEFTALCPVTMQPDFAELEFIYTPAQLCVELKSLKLYLHSFREVGAFHEDVTNRIADCFYDACLPKHLKVVGRFSVRGGISTTVITERGGE